MVEVTFVANIDTQWGDTVKVEADRESDYIRISCGSVTNYFTVKELQAVLSIGTAMQNGTLFPLPDPSADSHEAFS